MFYNSKTITPIVNQSEEKSNVPYFSLDITFIEKESYMVGTELSLYSGWVDFSGPGIGLGSSRTGIKRLSPYFGYFINPNSKFRFIPYFKVHFEQSFLTGLSKTFSRVGDFDLIDYKGTLFIEPIKRLQVAPGLGLILSWNPFSRIYLLGNIQYTYGYRPFQKYYFEYSYQGVEQPTAEWHANGTGVFATVGLGYKIWNSNKLSKGRRS